MILSVLLAMSVALTASYIPVTSHLTGNNCAKSMTSYGIVILIDLPGECSSQSIRMSMNGTDAGHCSLQLIQEGETTTSHTFGFYPSEGITLFNWNRSQRAELRDDSKREFDFSFLLVVDSATFCQVVKRIAIYSRRDFDLFNFNCIDFCMSVLEPVVTLSVEKDLIAGVNIRTPLGLRRSLLQCKILPQGSEVLSDCFRNSNQ